MSSSDQPQTPAGVGQAEEVTYGSYLCLDELLTCQRPLTEAHDEMLFIVIHQVYELWFKQILQEIALLQRHLESGATAGALHTGRRVATILKTVVGQLDVLETLTPRQFSAFRGALGSSSGFQSRQFRQLEAVFGRRDFDYPSDDPVLDAAIARPPIFASLLRYLGQVGWELPADALEHDPTKPWRCGAEVRALLVGVYQDETRPAAEVCEVLVDIDEGIQEWRYRHVKMVERVIGAQPGTGGSSGADYLRSTLFKPFFPELWEIRSDP